MKKALIAGAASVALAAMPVVGVFATGTDGTIYGSPLTDTLEMTVSEVCTLSRQATEHTSVAVEGVTGTWDPTDTTNDKFSATLVAGTEYAGLATSAYNVTCNHAVGGYEVTVATSAFTGVNGADTWAYSETGAFTADASSWYLTSSAKVTSSTPDAITNGGAVWTAATGTAVDDNGDFTITYSVKPKTTQQVGTYTATAVYTLANL